MADDLTAKAALAAAKGAMQNALTEAMSSEDERKQRKAEQAALAKRRRTKLIVFGVVGLLLALGVIGLVVSYWQWFLLLGVLGLAALYGRHRWRKRRDAKHPDEAKAPRPVAVLGLTDGTPDRVTESTSADATESVEDELAALKARFGK
jgi:Flp pilus assembly protein TadB